MTLKKKGESQNPLPDILAEVKEKDEIPKAKLAQGTSPIRARLEELEFSIRPLD